jgi:hypothetical protein
MRRSRQFLPALVAALCVLAVAAAALAEASEAGAEQPQKTAELLKVLETDGLTAVKAAAFEDLAVVGSAAAIPVLAPCWPIRSWHTTPAMLWSRIPTLPLTGSFETL